jgi:hypothetical protein
MRLNFSSKERKTKWKKFATDGVMLVNEVSAKTA